MTCLMLAGIVVPCSAARTAAAMLSAEGPVVPAEGPVVPAISPIAYGVSAPVTEIAAVPERSGDASLAGIRPLFVAVRVIATSPLPSANAPRVGVLVLNVATAVPVPLIEAVSNGLLLVSEKAAVPPPEAINSPNASAKVSVMLDVPVVVTPPTANPDPLTVAVVKLILDIPPEVLGRTQALGDRCPFGVAANAE